MQSITTFDSTQRGKLDEGGFIDIIGRRPGVKRMAFLALIFLSVFLTLVQHSKLFVSVSAFLHLIEGLLIVIIQIFNLNICSNDKSIFLQCLAKWQLKYYCYRRIQRYMRTCHQWLVLNILYPGFLTVFVNEKVTEDSKFWGTLVTRPKKRYLQSILENFTIFWTP